MTGGDVTGGQILGNSGADSITINGTANLPWHGGAGNDSITVGAVVGGMAVAWVLTHWLSVEVSPAQKC